MVSQQPAPARCACGAEVAYGWVAGRVAGQSGAGRWALTGPVSPCRACMPDAATVERERQSAQLLAAGFPARCVAETERTIRRQRGERDSEWRARCAAERALGVEPGDAAWWSVLREWRARPCSVALWGPVGTGKTLLLTALARTAVRDDPDVEIVVDGRPAIVRRSGTSAIYVTSRGVADAQARCFKGDYDAWGRLGRCGLLVIDELARDDEPSRLECDAIESLLSTRYDASRPVAVGTNAEWSAIVGDQPVYGQRVADRLREMCGERVFKRAGESWRGGVSVSQ